jgi:hypothetical protein
MLNLQSSFTQNYQVSYNQGGGYDKFGQTLKTLHNFGEFL